MEEYTWKEDLKARFEQGKAKAKQFGKDCVDAGKGVVKFVKEHPIESAAIATAVTTGFKTVGKFGDRLAEKKDRHEAERRFYDRSTGHYIWFKRKPNSRQLAEAQRIHYEYGTPYATIYRDMGLL